MLIRNNQDRLKQVVPWVVCLLVAMFYWYDYLLRVIPGVLIVPLMRDFHVDAFHIGSLSAAYYYAYTPLQLIAGAVVDRYTRRWVLFFSCLISACGGLLFAVSTSFFWVTTGRNLMGVGSAFAFVGALKLASLRLPHRQFELYVGALISIGLLGALTTNSVIAPNVPVYGWRATVMAAAVIGIVLAVLMLLFVRDQPFWLRAVPQRNRAFWQLVLEAFQQFKYAHIWLVGCLGGFLLLPISVFASLWFELFLKQNYPMTSVSASEATAWIFIGFAVGAPLVAWLSKKFDRRKPLLIVGTVFTFLLSAAVVYVPHFTHVWLLMILFMLGVFTSTQILVFGVAKDLSVPRHTGVTMASINFLISISPLIFQPWVGLWLSVQWHGKLSAGGVPIYNRINYDYAFIAMLVFLFVAIILACFLPETRNQTRQDRLEQGLSNG